MIYLFAVEQEVEECREQIKRAGETIQTTYKLLNEIKKELDEAAWRSERLESLPGRVEAMEQKVKAGDNEVQEILAKREAIFERGDEMEYNELSAPLKIAEESHTGATQILEILRAELKSLQDLPLSQDDEGISLDRMRRLKDKIEDQIRVFIQLEERLTEKLYQRALLKLKQKGNDWLQSLNDNYDGDNIETF